MKLLEVKNLSYNYEDNKVLKNINLHVKKGEIVSIVGTSGVGKTTLFNLISGIIKLQSGEILINSDSKNKISYMLQKDLLLEHKKVIDNISLPLILNKVGKKESYEEARKNLKLFNLADYEDKYPSELSGGMRQRISFLRTYMFKCPIFLLDEAFSALDAITKKNLQNWYLKISKELNLTTLLITHDIDEAVYLSDRIYILKNKPGEVVEEVEIKILSNEDRDLKNIKYKKEIIKIMGI